MLTFQFVLFSTVRSFDGFCPRNWGKVWVPGHVVSEGSSVGQPKGVLIRLVDCCGAICNCDGRRIGSTPASTKGASATGPTIVIRYSRLLTRLRSPPGKTIWFIGIVMVQILLPTAGLLGSLGT